MGLIKGYKEEIVEWVAGMSPDELDSLVQHYREKSTETSMGFSNPKHLTEEQRTLLISLRPSLKESTRFVSGLTYMTRGGAVRSCILFPTLHATDSAGFDRGVLFDDAVLVLDNPDYGKFESLGSYQICGRCYDEGGPIFPSTCAEKPEEKTGAVGQYHCPDCGAMLLAGIGHPRMCKPCLERKHPFFDRLT